MGEREFNFEPKTERLNHTARCYKDQKKKKYKCADVKHNGFKIEFSMGSYKTLNPDKCVKESLKRETNKFYELIIYNVPRECEGKKVNGMKCIGDKATSTLSCNVFF